MIKTERETIDTRLEQKIGFDRIRKIISDRIFLDKKRGIEEPDQMFERIFHIPLR